MANSRQIAEAIANGLGEAGHEVTVLSVSDAKPDPSMDFVVVGGSTRAARASGKIKRFAAGVAKCCPGHPFATFSTGASVSKKPNTQASERLYESLSENGMVPLAAPFIAGVQQMKGPLIEGELQRAEAFGQELGAKLVEKA